VLALTAAITGIAAFGLANNVFAGFQRRATDALLPSAPNDSRVAVVGFDRKTITAKGLGYPLPRDKVAQLVDRLHAEGARVITFDVIFSTDKTGDDQLAAAINRAGNVVLARDGNLGRADQGIITLRNPSLLASDLRRADYTIGHAKTIPDPADSVNRALPLVVEMPDGSFEPALSLAALMKYRGIAGPPIVRPNGVQVGDRFVPTIAQKSMLMNFSSRLSDPGSAISVADVLAGKVPRKKIDGKIVMIGALASTLGDNKLAPVQKSGGGIPGVLLHANALNTMLTGTYLDPVSNTTTVLWIALITLIIGTAVLFLPVWASLLVTMFVGAGYVFYAFTRFNSGHVLNFVWPSIAVAFAFVGGLGLRYFGETRQRRRVTTLFSQYVPEAVAQRLVDEDRASLAVEGERLDMTVLFCDLRGFTALSENLEPAIVRLMLNHYYDRVTDIVLSMRGTLMKYVGDEVFAVWGAPLPSSDHPQRALECAMAIQEVTPELNAELLEMGAPEVSFGIGLNTGDAVAAHFGGGRRRQYDVVGDTVNVGARLCSAAGRGEIILSDAVLTRVPSPPPVEPVGPIELKGVSRSLRLWRVAPPGSTTVGESAAVAGAAAALPDG
jgi:adenylate cyclase